MVSAAVERREVLTPVRLPEQKLWDRMRKGLAGFHIYLERLENMVGSGLPDVLTLKKGRTCFIELKVARDGIPARRNTPLLGNDDGLRLEQRNWLLNWSKKGGRSLVVISIAGSKQHIAINGGYGDRINKMSYTELCEAADVLGDTPDFWKHLHEYL